MTATPNVMTAPLLRVTVSGGEYRVNGYSLPEARELYGRDVVTAAVYLAWADR